MPTRRRTLARVGKIPTTAVRRLSSLFRRSRGFVLRICRRWASGKAKWARRSASASSEQLGDGGEASRQAVRHPAQLLGCGGLVGLLEDAADGGRHHILGAAGHEIEGVPGGMDAAALPCGAQELAAHGLHDAPVGVADDEPGAGEAALQEPPHEA